MMGLSLTHHRRVHWAFFQLAIKQLVTYRLNTLVGGFYSLVYYGMILATTALVIPPLAPAVGWSTAELWLLFGVTSAMVAVLYALHIHSFRFIMREGIREGMIDQWLLKPINTRFAVTHFRIGGEDILFVTLANGVMLALWWPLRGMIAPLQYAAALLTLLISWHILYYWLTILAGSAFFITRNEQLLEVFDKSSDLAHYPQSVFPNSLRLSLMTILPTAFLGYSTTSILLSKTSNWFVVESAFILAATVYCSHLVWKYGLRKYSSASS